MIMKANKQIGFIYKDNESIDKILKDGDVVFERGFLREKTSTTLPITFGGVGKDLKDYKVYGNTYQNSTSGKNLLNSSIVNWQKNNLDGNLKYEENRNIIKFVTTPVYISGIYIGKNSVPTLINNFNATTEYTISFEITSDKNIGTTRFGFENNYLNVPLRANETKKIVQKSTYGAIVIYFQSAEESANVEVKNIMITSNDNDNFEPYTNGASPNPDYPQEIISCGDRTKNLYNYKTDNLNNSLDNLTVSLDNDGYLIINGTNNTNYRTPISGINITDLIEDGQTYTIFQEDITPSDITNNFSKVEVRIVRYKNDGTIEYPRTNGKHTARITIDKTNYIKYEINVVLPQAGDTYSNYKNRFMLLKGSYTDDNVPSYESYGYKIPVNVRSDNLFDKDNVIKLNGTISADYVRFEGGGLNYTAVIPCKSNTTYTVKKRNDGNVNRFALASSETIPSSTPSELTPLLNKIRDNVSSNLSLTTGSTANYLIVQYYRTTESVLTEQQILDSIMIVEGSTAPSKYIPYYNETTNIYLDEPLRGIGEYSDYIDFINGKVVRNIGNKVLDGSETYYGGGAGTGSPDYTYVYTKVFDSLAISGVCPIFSSHFATIKGNMARGTVVSIDTMCIDKSASTDRTRFLILTSRLSASTTSAFKTWLQSNNVTVDYVLETPTEEDIELPNIPTLDGNNTLNIETEITPSQVYIKYKSNS